MRSLQVLLADDSPDEGQRLSDYLREAGHSVTLVHSGEEAVLAYFAQSFDLVLMDLTMPGIGGLTAIKTIKSVPAAKWVPIIIITELPDEAGVLDGYLAGADDYIVKPLRPMILDIRIRSMMRIAAIQRTTAAVIDNVIEGIIQIDRVGRITCFNRAAENIFGYAAIEVLGHNVSMLMPSPDRERHDEYIGNFVATGVPKIIGIGRQVMGLRRSGETFPMQLGITEVATPDGKSFVGLVRDLTAK
ncbi:MAG: PAS domain S-box protein [Pseudomonadota bacterium]